ncbi:hypothetical protein K443DRAFT_131791 [Laccaria amethystina LaAM-08-1]|uniref:Uncharacterized protein n=1 Tax=Laccaria amethystina LaAM-08-1 TaxID=1095629 RepID=A0A0C9WTV8_9AGAR|nr:hypothetical protein K443DRAFT_131791 [Laccaria amethystina LaAM-08-1]
MSSPISVQRVEEPTDDQVNASVAIFVALMKTRADPALMDPMARCMLRAGIHSGEFYTATDKTGEVIGFSLWMPPGEELFSTPEQRSLGFTDFMNSLPEIGKQYYATTVTQQNLILGGAISSWSKPNTSARAKRNGDTLALSTTNDDNIGCICASGVIRCNHSSKISFTLIKLLQLLPPPELLGPLCADVALTPTRWGLVIMSITQPQSIILLINVMICLIPSIVEHEASRPNFKKFSRPVVQPTPLLLGVGCFSIVICNGCNAFIPPRRISYPSRRPSEDKLEFRNTYIGLDDLYSSKEVRPSKYDRIVNVPRLAAQVSQIELELVHSILQFGVMDYGTERCSLTICLPSCGDALPHPYSFKDIVGGEVQMKPFPCKSGAFLAFEISCAPESPDCGIEVWSNQNETWGAFLYQFQTI